MGTEGLVTLMTDGGGTTTAEEALVTADTINLTKMRSTGEAETLQTVAGVQVSHHQLQNLSSAPFSIYSPEPHFNILKSCVNEQNCQSGLRGASLVGLAAVKCCAYTKPS